MRYVNYTLRPLTIDNAKPREKAYALTDGGGLLLEVLPSGTKTWRFKYHLNGKREKVTIGAYPAFTIKQARDRHEELRAMVEHGQSPAKSKQTAVARLAGLSEVPVVVRDAPADPYAQAAENQKRHGLTTMDLARLIRRQADAGDSNATIAKRLSIDQTTIAHHLALLELPPELNEAMQAGRCTSPRTLYELNKLHRDEPDRVRALLAGDGDITRSNVNAARTEPAPTAHAPTQRRAQPPLLAQADAACARLELVLDRIVKTEPRIADADREALKQRIASLGGRFA